MHFAGTLPSPNGRERIASTHCYAPASGEYNSRAYAAMPDRPMTHRGSISPAKPPFGYARGSMLVPTVPRPSPSAGCGGAQLRDAAVPSCGGGRRRDERAGALARAAYWGGHGRDIDARRLPGAREGHRRAPFAGCGDALTCSLLGARGPSAAGSQPAEAWSRLGRERAAATRTRIRTAAPSAHQTRRSCCRYALRRDGAVSFARAVR